METINTVLSKDFQGFKKGATVITSTKYFIKSDCILAIIFNNEDEKAEWVLDVGGIPIASTEPIFQTNIEIILSLILKGVSIPPNAIISALNDFERIPRGGFATLS
jgi:hypothetical protein